MAVETVHGGLTAIGQVVSEIERVRAAHEIAIASLRDRPIVIPIENGVVVPQNVAEARIKAIQAQREASILEREAALQREIIDLRDKGREKLEAARLALETEYYRAIMEAGPKGAEWAEAQARMAFAKEDIARQDAPAGIVELYQTALAAGDKTGAWLYARYGGEHLAALTKDADLGVAGPAAYALGELERLAWSGAVAARREAEGKLNELQRKLNEPQSRSERLEEAERWAAHLGMSQTPEQIVEMGLIDAARRFEYIAFRDVPA